MSDDEAYADLERYVDRAVGRIHTTQRRKAVMREEMLAHLSATFAQERERSGDASAALAATFRRFGDCDLLARELEASVPALERIIFLLLNRERLMWRLLVSIGLLVTLVGTGMVLPALAMLKKLAIANGNSEPLMRPVVGVMIGVVIVMVGVHLLGWGIVRRIWKKRPCPVAT